MLIRHGEVGRVKNVFSALKTDTFSFTAEADVTGLSFSVTAKAGEKVVIFADVPMSGTSIGDGIVIKRDTTVLAQGDAAGSRIRIAGATGYENAITGQMVQNSIAVIDTPGAGTFTYKVTARKGSAGTSYINRSINDTDSTDRARSCASLIGLLCTTGA